MPLATYFFALTILLIIYKEKRLIFFLSIILALLMILIVVKTHKFYNDYNIISSTQYHQGLVVEKTLNVKRIRSAKIINLQPGF